MLKGFGSKTKKEEPKIKKQLGNQRMFYWSPWPPANFQNKYPALPLVMTIIILSIGQFYLSMAR